MEYMGLVWFGNTIDVSLVDFCFFQFVETCSINCT